VLIRRPTIIVGGELSMDNLEITTNRLTGIGEAPLQMKSNCGTLVIDDFGRQRLSPTELLNRWIVPLEKRLDYLSLMSGRKIEIPFDQMIVFSTNLEPGDLVDEAFTRRIPYKIQVQDPTPEDFRVAFHKIAGELSVQCDDDVVTYLIKRHYEPQQRPMRFCHPRDLLRQVIDYCSIHQQTPVLTTEAIDAAVENYFCGW
jgi:predicted ATPase with chaperone activity